MSSYRYKPSKPAAILGIVVGAAMIGFAVTSFGDADGGMPGFLIFWIAAVVAITGLNTWAAFSEKGSLATFARVPDEDDGRDRTT